MALHLPYLKKFTKKVMTPYYRILSLMNLENFITIWDAISTESGEHTLHTYLHESNNPELVWKSLRPYFGWQSEQVIQNTYKV